MQPTMPVSQHEPDQDVSQEAQGQLQRPLSTYNLFLRQEQVRKITGSMSGMAVAVKKGTKRKAWSRNAKAGLANTTSKLTIMPIAKRSNLFNKEAHVPFKNTAAGKKERYKRQIAL